MKIKSFSVRSYRSFEHEATIELRPLTLLFGYNSQGKSVLLRTLPLLASSVQGSASSPLNLGTELTREGSFTHLLCRLNASSSLSFGLTMESQGGELERLDLQLREDSKSRRQFVERLRICTTDVEPPIDLTWDLDLSNGTSLTYEATLGSEKWTVPLTFEGITPAYASSEPAEVTGRLRAMQLGLRTLAAQTHWLSALRKVPQRWASYRRRLDKLGTDGTGVSEILAADALEGGEVLALVSSWFERATGFRLRLPEGAGRTEADIFSLEISPKDNSAMGIPIVDTGEGMIQVLPVLVLVAMATLGKLGNAPVLAIEHPELHLHPAAHADLAEVFCEAARSDGPSLLVETHSENLLRRVQLAIAKEEISPDQVLVYWIRQDDDGHSIAEAITFDKLAVPVGYTWPPGVFSEASELARELALKRRQLRSS